MISLGLICYQGHSSSVALCRDGQILFAVSEERFTRVKNDDSFPSHSIDFLLQQFNLKIDQIDHIGIAWSPRLTLIGQIKNLSLSSFGFIFDKREGSNKRSRLQKFLLIANIKREIKKRYQYNGKISFISHHLSHSMCAYVQSQQKDAVVFVADGMGEFAASTIYEFNGGNYKIIYQDKFPNSLGVLYSAGTQYLKFKPDSDEFKIMGLAAYGKSDRFLENFKQLFYFEGGSFFLNKEFFGIQKNGNQFYSNKFAMHFGKLESFEDQADFALALQKTLENIVFSILKKNRDKFQSSNFVSSGGVFLNCLMNQKLRESQLFKTYSFFPVADDNGTCIGAAQVLQLKNGFDKLTGFSHLYLGPDLKVDTSLIPRHLKFREFSDVAEIAQLLSDGKVIGWIQGRMEFGHRALGNRSILASPMKSEMKDIVNKKIKFREAYRPFAPSIVKEKLEEFFELPPDHSCDFPYMIETLKAKESARRIAPAIVHQDNTSRVHTVDQTTNPKFYHLLNEFYKITQCPILLNTSFNLNGMPIVNTFEDALNCYIQTELDYLVAGNLLIWK